MNTIKNMRIITGSNKKVPNVKKGQKIKKVKKDVSFEKKDIYFI